MTNKDITIQQLNEQKKELKEKLEHMSLMDSVKYNNRR